MMDQTGDGGVERQQQRKKKRKRKIFSFFRREKFSARCFSLSCWRCCAGQQQVYFGNRTKTLRNVRWPAQATNRKYCQQFGAVRLRAGCTFCVAENLKLRKNGIQKPSVLTFLSPCVCARTSFRSCGNWASSGCESGEQKSKYLHSFKHDEYVYAAIFVCRQSYFSFAFELFHFFAFGERFFPRPSLFQDLRHFHGA